MQVKTETKIHPKRNRSGSVSYRVDLGMVQGKRKQPTFPTLAAAQEFKRKADEEIRRKSPLALSDLAQSTRYEVLGALEKLRPYGASLNDAVEFFLKHAKPSKPAISFKEAIREFLKIKTKAGLSQRYLESAEEYFGALQKFFKDCLVTNVDFKQAEGYIYNKNHKWNQTTRRNHLRHGVLLFNFLAERGYISRELNPFAKVPKPKQIESKVTCLTTADVKTLLQHALDSNAKAECACMVLVLFCGIRVEEAQKLDWQHINLEQRRVEVTAAIAKKGRRRSNEIPKNALAWLECCASTGRVSPKNYSNRLRKVREGAKIEYHQNAMRHSFASYHVAAFKNASATAVLLGHPNAVLLYNTYRDVVHHKDALKFWNILPKGVMEKNQHLVDSIKMKLSLA